MDEEWVIRRNKSRYRYKTVWSDSKYNANTFGSKLLGDILGRKGFSFPKSVYNVQDCVLATTQWDKGAWVADFFAGSGTTVHGIFCANKFDGGTRKFIAIEMGAYFDTVLVERVRRCAYSDSWLEGKPQARESGTSQFVKVLELETYEDALANLSIRALDVQQAQLVEANPSMYEDFMLRYMLNAATEGSASTLNVQAFDHPFEYKLKVAADTVGETKDVSVDLVETFNWLLGLRVHTIDVIRGFHVVTGRLPGQGNSENGEKALIIWRDTTENPNEKLDEFFDKQAFNTLDQEFDVIYVNGDNNLQNKRNDEHTWKVRLIEEEFHRLMWDVEDV
jgi:adenine-specific DNA-methyltransferase